jgi:hypothetical protein
MSQIDKKSPSLGVISNQSSDGRERRRVPRLSLTTEQFRLGTLNQLFPIADLSSHGMGFWLSDLSNRGYFTVGLLLEGTLSLNRQKYPIQARVRSLGLDRIGCEFENLLPETKQALSVFLDPVRLGAEMKLIPASELNSLWYHGPSGTDLLFQKGDHDPFQKFVLYVLGMMIQWDAREGLVTGRVTPSVEQSDIRGIHRFESMILDYDSQVDPSKLSIAKTVIMSSNLSQDLKSWCVHQLER